MFAGAAHAQIANDVREIDPKVLSGAGTRALTLAGDRHQSMMDAAP
jgi:hypothetical protein